MTLMDVYRKVPTSVCFGVDDTICPSHIGAFLSTLTRGEIMIHNIENANHNPCVNTGCMVKILDSIVDGTNTNIKTNGIQEPIIKKRQCRGYSYPSFIKTRESFQSIYHYLITNTEVHSE